MAVKNLIICLYHHCHKTPFRKKLTKKTLFRKKLTKKIPTKLKIKYNNYFFLFILIDI